MSRAIIAALVLCLSINAKASDPWPIQEPVPLPPGFKKWECAIFLCLPVAFSAPNCNKAFDAMIKRTLQFKSPIPNPVKCFIGGGSAGNQMVPVNGEAIMIFPVNALGVPNVEQWQIIDNITCADFNRLPESENHQCVMDYKTVIINQNGAPISNTYYIGTDGSSFYKNEFGILVPVAAVE